MIKGYVKKILYISQKNIDENDEDNYENNEDNYENIYFVIVIVIDNDNNDYKIKGDIIMKPEEGDIIICTDYIINKDKYDNGNIYNAKGLLTIKLPHDKKYIINRLISLKIKNFGKIKIEKIVEKYGEDIWNIELLSDDIITRDFKEKIINYKKSKNKFLCDTKAKYILDYICETFNISLNIREYELIKKNINYKTISYPIKNEDYEKIILNITGYISQEKLLKICNKMKLSNEIKLKILIISVIKEFIHKGNSCVPESDLFFTLEKYDDYIELKNLYDITVIIDYLINNEYIIKYEDVYYDAIQYYYEKNIADKIKLIYDNSKQNKYEEINELPSNEKFNKLNDEQKKAYINAINCPLSIITGGPGFGKTSIIARVVDFIKDNNNECVILGPTGKIVSKIKNDPDIDKSCCNIYTIHRFLNIKYLEFHTENNDYNNERNEEYKHIKNSKFIIIDEMSMISNELLSRFFDYIDNEELTGNIIFIGDVKQLPSIESGNTLSHLIDSHCIPKIKLQHSFRQKNNPALLNTIENINKQKIPDNNEDYKFIKINNLDDCSNKLENLINDLLSQPNYKFKDIIIITPTRKNINNFSDKIRVLHHKYNITKIDINKPNNFVIGDYIMINKNIYKYNEDMKFKKNNDGIIEYIKIKCSEDLFNGMVGYIIDIRDENKKKYYVIKFDNELIGEFEYDFFNKQEINSMSYINTVHKYQGSENRIAIILITENDKYFADKKLLYTAISRAKEKCYVIGEIDILKKAIKKNMFRKSKLNNMINSNFKSENNNIDYNKSVNIKKYDDDIKIGIPTIGVGNIKYRSRIEAKWSYMFEYLKWNVKYEPLDLQGYIPDFILKHEPSGKIKNLLIEIKNEPDEYNFETYYKKAFNSGWGGALLILNHDFDINKVNDDSNQQNIMKMIILGKIYFYKKNKIRKSNFYLYKNECGDYRYFYVYKHKYYYNINKECDLKNKIEIDNNTTDDDILVIKQIWNNISNKTQYKSGQI